MSWLGLAISRLKLYKSWILLAKEEAKNKQTSKQATERGYSESLEN